VREEKFILRVKLDIVKCHDKGEGANSIACVLKLLHLPCDILQPRGGHMMMTRTRQDQKGKCLI